MIKHAHFSFLTRVVLVAAAAIPMLFAGSAAQAAAADLAAPASVTASTDDNTPWGTAASTDNTPWGVTGPDDNTPWGVAGPDDNTPWG